MYPNLPKTAAELVPLPLVEGPKLQPFDFKGPQKIKFLACVGEGIHATVYKVEILGSIYALKLFSFSPYYEWYHCILPHPSYNPPPPAEELQALYPYLDHFNNECRAFGRLRDAGCEDLAVKCFGYVLLDEDSEREILEFGGCERYIDPAMRDALMTDPAGPPPPFRCIIKEFGQVLPHEASYNLPISDLRNAFKTVCHFHNLGIIDVDPKSDQIINGKHTDFSCAVTTPHILTTPEINPQLSELQRLYLELETFQLCVHDFTKFDLWVSQWVKGDLFVQEVNPPAHKVYEGPFAYPGGGQLHGSKNRYDLRPSTLHQRTLYTFADPRRFDWKASLSSPSPSPMSQERDVHAQKREEAVRKPRNSRHWPGASRSMWRYDPTTKIRPQAQIRLRDCDGDVMMKWEVRDGYIFPKKYAASTRPSSYVNLDTGFQEALVYRSTNPTTPAKAMTGSSSQIE